VILVKPSYQILAASKKDSLLPYSYDKLPDKLIELAGRMCYKSEDKIDLNSSGPFVQMLKKSEHLSVIEHSWELRVYDHCNLPYCKYLNFLKLSNDTGYIVAGNYRAFKEWKYDKKDDYCTPTKEIYNAIYHFRRWDMLAATVKFVMNRGISHELVRHRPASFSQESTRWCNYSKSKFDNNITFIIPLWFYEDFKECKYDGTEKFEKKEVQMWFDCLKNIEESYLKLTSEYNISSDKARGLLPNDLKTEIIVTADLNQWKNIIFKLRGTEDCKSHIQMKELMIPLHEEFKDIFPEVFKSGVNR